MEPVSRRAVLQRAQEQAKNVPEDPKKTILLQKKKVQFLIYY